VHYIQAQQDCTLTFYIARALAAQKNKENKLSAMANVIFETWNL